MSKAEGILLQCNHGFDTPIVTKEQALNAMKEMAGMAYEAGQSYGSQSVYYDSIDSEDERQVNKPPSKEDFMKKYFD